MPLKPDDVRKMTPEQRRRELLKLRRALLSMITRKQRGALKETGKIKSIKRDIARILTIMRELGEI
ncbi:MAG: 50S ribosomal protein L29 [Candidatus Njordarchaeales archaeon]